MAVAQVLQKERIPRFRVRSGISRSVEKGRKGVRAQRHKGKNEIYIEESPGEGSFSFRQRRRATGDRQQARGVKKMLRAQSSVHRGKNDMMTYLVNGLWR